MKKWYAVKRNRSDFSINNGSRDRAEAEKMCRDLGKDAFIAIYNDNGGTPECIGEIHQDQFESTGSGK